MKKSRLILPVLALAASGPLSGCGTFATHGLGNPPYRYQEGVYRGTGYDASWFDGKGAWIGVPDTNDEAFIGLLIITPDLLLSLVLDTVFLPYDLFDGPEAPAPRVEQSETYQKPLVKPVSESGGEA